MIYHSGDDDLHGLEATLGRAKSALWPHLDSFDSMIVTGMSGVVVGVPLSLALGKPVVILRKPGDSAHSSMRAINSKMAGQRIIFVDDFVSEGHTRTRCHDFVTGIGARLVGQYLYRPDAYTMFPEGQAPEEWRS